MILEPYGERLIVKREESDTYEGSIIIKPDTAKKASLIGEVVEAGPDCIAVKPGDRILYARYSGFEMPPLGDDRYKNCLVMIESDILAKITGEEGEG